MGYQIVRFIIRLIIGLSSRVQFQGLENLPASGGYIIASNHLGRLDAVMVYNFLGRRDVALMVAEKYGRSAIVRWLARQVDAFFVDRFNADLGAMREAMRRIKEGQVLVVAPEGTRSRTGALIEGRPGVSYIAARSGAPILPVAIIGSEDRRVVANLKRLRKTDMLVRVGEPFTLPPLKGPDRDAELKHATDEIMCRIAALLPPEYRGVYANHPRLKELLAGAQESEAARV